MINSTESAKTKPDVMAEEMPEKEELQETPTLPLTAFGEGAPKEGDTFTGTIISVDEDSGIANVGNLSLGGGMNRRMRGSDAMAEELNQPKQEGM